MAPRRPALTALAAALLVLSGTACGGDSGSGESSSTSSGHGGSAGTESWANGFCASVSTWQNSVSKVSASLSDPKTLAAQGLQDDVQKVGEATRALVTQLQDVPELSSAATTSAVQSSLSDLQAQIQQEANKVTTLPAPNPTSASELAQDASAIGGILTAITADITSTLAEIQKTVDGADPTKPFKEAPACQSLTSSPTS